MKTRSIISLTLAALTILAATRDAYAAAEPVAKPEPAAKTEATAKAETGKTKLVLAKGLEAEAILKGYGKPYEIKSMEAPDKETKVEQWIYRRKLKEVATQVATGQTMVPTYSGFSGPGASVTEVAVPEYRMTHVTIYQVTALLMVNGKLEIAKQWQDQEETQN